MERQRAFLLGCIAVAAAASLAVVLPFVEYVLGAVVLGVLIATVKTYVEEYETMIEPAPDPETAASAASDEPGQSDATPPSIDDAEERSDTDGLADGADPVE